MFREFIECTIVFFLFMVLMHFAVRYCAEIPTTPPVKNYHLLTVNDIIDDTPPVPLPPFKKFKRSHAKPSEPNTGAPIEEKEITIEVKGPQQ